MSIAITISPVDVHYLALPDQYFPHFVSIPCHHHQPCSNLEPYSNHCRKIYEKSQNSLKLFLNVTPWYRQIKIIPIS